MEKELQIALVGNPNAGKSSLFNRMTGLNQRVGNFPGITVDKKTGKMPLPNGGKAQVLDLPGTYSLYPTSLDERIVLNVLTNRQHPDFPDLVVYVADVTNLGRHLLLLTQLVDLQLPVVLALNMMDLAEKANLTIHQDRLSLQLGIPVIKVNGRTGAGLEQLKIAALQTQKPRQPFTQPPPDMAHLIQEVQARIGLAHTYEALLTAHHFRNFPHLTEAQRAKIAQVVTPETFPSIKLQVEETIERFGKIERLVHQTIIPNPLKGEQDLTTRLDNLLTHPLYGLAIFFGLLFLMFQAVFAWAEYPMNLIDQGMGALKSSVDALLPDTFWASLITDGIITGIGGVVIFVPQIAILTAFIALLEEIGYMSRAVFLSDHLMRRFGLNGRSMVSLVSGAACAIPAIMATRTIGNWKERLITVFVTPFISCSARIPVYTVLIAFAVPAKYYLGWINLQGLTILGLYLLGLFAALGSAYVLQLILKTEEKSYLVLEMPQYRMPHWQNLGLTVWEKVRAFVLEAGKVILLISVVLWALASFGPPGQMEAAAKRARANHPNPQTQETAVAAAQLEASFAGQMGKLMEPVIAPLGFDWKIGIALVTSFAAREVFVASIATIYGMGEEADEQTVLQSLKNRKGADGQMGVFSPATAASLLVFYVLAMQCMSTLAVVKRETGSWKWPMLQLGYMTALAYLLSLLTYQILQ